MKPPEIPGPYVAELAPKPVSPFKVVVIILVTLSVLGVLFVGSVTAIAFGIYRMRAREQKQAVAQAEAVGNVPTTEALMSLNKVVAPRVLQKGDLVLTATAAHKLREALKAQPDNAHVLVGVDVDPQSCTGLKYRLTVESAPSSRDYCLGKVEGIPIAVERESWALLRGTKLDYLVASESTQGFVFENPNQTQGTQSAPGDTTMAARSSDAEPLQAEVDESFLPPRQTETADAILRRMRERMEESSAPSDPLARMRERQKQYEAERRQREAEHERRIEEIMERQREMVRRASQPPTFP